jgi:CheY-like chemotaxis protein
MFQVRAMKILIVEDEPALREIVADILFTGDHDVRAVATGAAGLGMLKSWAPDLVIADLGLADIPGEEVARIAATMSCRPRIVLMSAERERLDTMRSTVDAVFQKPFHLDQMTSLIELFHRSYLREQFKEKAMKSKMMGALFAGFCVLVLTACGVSEGTSLPGAPSTGGSSTAVSNAIPGGTWRLVSIREKGSDRVTVVDPQAFTAEFGSDGRVNLRADCNRCTASYTAGSRNLKVGVMACTRAFCTATTPDDTTFTALVESAQTWTSEDGQLELSSTSGVLHLVR